MSLSPFLHRRVAAALEPFGDTVELEESVVNMFVRAGGLRVAEISERAYRMIPGSEWVTFRPIALRNDVARILAGREAPAPRPPKPPPSPVSQPEPPVREPKTSLHEEAARAAWVEALRRRGVPVIVVGDEVRIAGIGAVDVPEGDAGGMSRKAKALVRKRTTADLTRLAERAKLAVGSFGGAVVPDKKRVAIRLHGVDVAWVDRYRVVTAGGKTLAEGDLLGSDEPWKSVTTRLRTMAAELQRRQRIATVRPAVAPKRPARADAPTAVPAPRGDEAPDLRFTLPSTLSAAAREAAIGASARLRTERRLVPATTVEVTTPRSTIVFEALVEGENPLEARFVFNSGAGRVAGALRLKRPSDPLTLRVGHTSSEAFVGPAWATALIVYAELTCTELAERVAPRHSDEHPRRRRAGLSAPAPVPTRRLPSTRGSGGVRLEPLPAMTLTEAIDRLQSVSGHLRRLSRGHRASHDAVRSAEQAGIRLPQGYTWVRPHRRGGEAAVRVLWPASKRLW